MPEKLKEFFSKKCFFILPPVFDFYYLESRLEADGDMTGDNFPTAPID